MITGKYDYSIEVARRIYCGIKNDVEAIEVCKKNIEDYYRGKGIEPELSVKNSDSMTFYDYRGGNQSVSLQTMFGKPAAIILMQYEHDTDRLLEEAFYEKESFGLPVFRITVMQDMPQAMLSLMSRESYVSLDTPQEQQFRHTMNYLDDIISKYGGDNDW